MRSQSWIKRQKNDESESEAKRTTIPVGQTTMKPQSGKEKLTRLTVLAVD
jgi:hypothetical protein